MRGRKGFVAGFVLASVLFGSLGAAAELMMKDITVAYAPLKYLFDEVEKAPPQDQRGFIYNGRTFVSLRFAAEALGKEVGFDPETYTIYVGRRSSAVPALWNDAKQSSANLKLEYFTTGIKNIRGYERPNTLLISAYAMKGTTDAKPITIEKRFPLDGSQTVITGNLFVPETYYGRDAQRRLGRISFLNERNEQIFSTPIVDPAGPEVDYPLNLEVKGVFTLRMIVELYPQEGLEITNDMLVAQFGLQDFSIK